jgi:hypothetical protein
LPDTKLQGSPNYGFLWCTHGALNLKLEMKARPSYVPFSGAPSREEKQERAIEISSGAVTVSTRVSPDASVSTVLRAHIACSRSTTVGSGAVDKGIGWAGIVGSWSSVWLDLLLLQLFALTVLL